MSKLSEVADLDNFEETASCVSEMFRNKIERSRSLFEEIS